MQILVFGKDGQLGKAFRKLFDEALITQRHIQVRYVGRDDCDLANADAITALLEQVRPNLIINAAAYTAVDKAETETDLALAINSDAPGLMARYAASQGVSLLHFSTDYVFDGLKKNPYTETDKPNPLSVYGKTKYKGEEFIRSHPKHFILRTSWIFSSRGHNFLKTILRLIKERDELSIVNDQRGSPTSATLLSEVTFNMVQQIAHNKNFKDFGTYHLTSNGETTWYAYACFIVDEALRLGFDTSFNVSHIKPITTLEYPTPAKRPLNAKLNTSKIQKTFMLELPSWQEEVRKILKELLR